MKGARVLHHQAASDLKAFVFAKNKERWTCGRLTSEVSRLARGFIGLGIWQGDRVALHMANLPELGVAYLACFKVGAIAAPLSGDVCPPRLQEQFSRAFGVPLRSTWASTEAGLSSLTAWNLAQSVGR